MTDTTPSAAQNLRVVRGEMNAPWSDASGQSYAAGGPLLEEFVAALDLGGARRVLIAGPHTTALVAKVADVAADAQVTALVRSVGDAEALCLAVPGVEVVAGSLEGFVETAPEPFDAVLALDGVDRLESYDSSDLSWADSTRALIGLGGDEGLVVLSHAYDTAPVNLLDARPADRRHGDDEMRPLRADRTRPAGARGFLLPLTPFSDRQFTQAYSLFGPPNAPRLIVEGVEFGAPEAFVGYAVSAARSHRRPLLAPADEMIRVLARGNRLDEAADGGLLVLGAAVPVDFLHASAGGAVSAGRYLGGDGRLEIVSRSTAGQWPDDAAVEVVESETAQPSETAKYLPIQTAPTRTLDRSIEPAADLLPATIALGSTVEDEFVRLAALGDVPAFRELAGAVGRFVESLPVTERRAVRFDNIHLDGRGFSHGLEALRWTDTVGTAQSLAAAFWLLQDRLRRDDLRHPWPDHVGGESLVALWLEMAGHEHGADEAAVTGRQLADALALPGAFPTGPVPDLRTALTDAATARRELAEAQGQIFGLERTIGFRDKQLRTREDVIRNLRAKGGSAAPGAAAAPSVTKMVKRATEVRSVGELTAGINRVVNRAKRQRAKK